MTHDIEGSEVSNLTDPEDASEKRRKEYDHNCPHTVCLDTPQLAQSAAAISNVPWYALDIEGSEVSNRSRRCPREKKKRV